MAMARHQLDHMRLHLLHIHLLPESDRLEAWQALTASDHEARLPYQVVSG